VIPLLRITRYANPNHLSVVRARGHHGPFDDELKPARFAPGSHILMFPER
jgi:hypothetical protein